MPLGAAFLHIGQVIAAAERVTEIIEQNRLLSLMATRNLKQKCG